MKSWRVFEIFVIIAIIIALIIPFLIQDKNTVKPFDDSKYINTIDSLERSLDGLKTQRDSLSLVSDSLSKEVLVKKDKVVIITKDYESKIVKLDSSSFNDVVVELSRVFAENNLR